MLAGIDPSVAQEEGLQVLACLQAHLQRVLPGASQVAQRLMFDVRYPDRSELPSTQEFGQACAVAPIRLDSVSRPLRNQRRGDHLAGIAVLR